MVSGWRLDELAACAKSPQALSTEGVAGASWALHGGEGCGWCCRLVSCFTCVFGQLTWALAASLPPFPGSWAEYIFEVVIVLALQGAT